MVLQRIRPPPAVVCSCTGTQPRPHRHCGRALGDNSGPGNAARSSQVTARTCGLSVGLRPFLPRGGSHQGAGCLCQAVGWQPVEGGGRGGGNGSRQRSVRTPLTDLAVTAGGGWFPGEEGVTVVPKEPTQLFVSPKQGINHGRSCSTRASGCRSIRGQIDDFCGPALPGPSVDQIKDLRGSEPLF